MENKIYKKLNSFENFKRIFFLLSNPNKKKFFFSLCYQKFFRLSFSLINKIMYIYNGKNFIKLKIFLFCLGLPIGDLCLTKKNNRHLSLKKIKNQKR